LVETRCPRGRSPTDGWPVHPADSPNRLWGLRTRSDNRSPDGRRRNATLDAGNLDRTVGTNLASAGVGPGGRAASGEDPDAPSRRACGQGGQREFQMVAVFPAPTPPKNAPEVETLARWPVVPTGGLRRSPTGRGRSRHAGGERAGDYHPCSRCPMPGFWNRARSGVTLLRPSPADDPQLAAPIFLRLAFPASPFGAPQEFSTHACARSLVRDRYPCHFRRVP
jgi:hypothetical protein